MIKINLLPPELRRRRRRRVVIFEPTQTLLIIVVACELVAFMGGFVWLNLKTGERQKELNGIKVEVERTEKEVKHVKELEQDARRLEQRVQIIDKLMFSRLLWSRKLNELSNLLPQNVWITSFSISKRPVAQPGGGASVVRNTLLLRGKVLNPPGEKAVNLVGVLINNMRSYSYFFEAFSDVELISTSTAKEKDREVLNFSLQLPFKR